ncbi:hypothetical protein EKO04_001398 [Ascochyta lentis]|uniref:Uncharacterized protein n=1 Tax=Ascochyta lentis TaxID=205686 RepID=A0A8H7JCZ9_9PLEO|nr:hypothetical protein EKO04_001398 [Ascochyta lentis]
MTTMRHPRLPPARTEDKMAPAITVRPKAMLPETCLLELELQTSQLLQFLKKAEQFYTVFGQLARETKSYQNQSEKNL